jgi:hypothetical protein
MSASVDITLRDLFRTLDERKRPEDVAKMITKMDGPSLSIKEALRLPSGTRSFSLMSGDFQRSRASVATQLKVAPILFASAAPDDPDDIEAVQRYIVQLSRQLVKKVGKNDYKHDRLNKEQRDKLGIDLSRRQYNKRFRILARMEDKLIRRAREISKRAITLASKSRLASRITWEQFSTDIDTACFIAYYTARCNVRSIFTVNAQARPYDEACDGIMKTLNESSTTNWFAVSHVMPDERIVKKLSQHQRGLLIGSYYEMLLEAGKFLNEVWESSSINAQTMIVQRGQDSSTWNLTAGAWNKLRDGWFNLLHVMDADTVLEYQCIGKVMRLMAADVAHWHRSTGGKTHTDTDVWAELPLPWKVLSGEEICTRQQIVDTCNRFGIDPLKSGWLARRGEKSVESFSPTPELVHGVIVSSPAMAKVMRRMGVFSGKTLRVDNVEVDIYMLIAAEEARSAHFAEQTGKKICAI